MSKPNFLEAQLAHFLLTYCSERAPLLLGLSGGPDSMALFWLLKKVDYPFSVAHVDHGWREESGEEAVQLKALCQQHQIPFFVKRLEPLSVQRNLEDEGRKARLAFFKEIVVQEGLEGVLLAHQADDQAETVLKRLFEGASLPKLKGLSAKTEIDGLTILRPLLRVRKEEILRWLEGEGISYFLDPTNRDERFLRGRMRRALMPQLSQSFGKEVTPSLCRIGESAEELSAFIEEQISPYVQRIQSGASELSLDFAPDLPQSPFLWKMAIRYLFESQKIALSNYLLESLLKHLQQGSCHKSFKIGQRVVQLHRKKLTIRGVAWECEIGYDKELKSSHNLKSIT